MSVIRIEVPVSVVDLDLPVYLLDNHSQFRQAFNRRAKDHDPRTEVDTYRIIDVQIGAEKAIIRYEVDFSLRYGCQDLEHCDTHRRQLTARREGRFFIFEYDSPIEMRSTSDEF